MVDDGHSPLALEEILLAGCPTVSVRTGASFVRHGITGMIVERLPPGRECVANEGDEAALATFRDALRRAQHMDRQAVRASAAEQFATGRIIDAVLTTLHEARSQAFYRLPPIAAALRAGNCWNRSPD